MGNCSLTFDDILPIVRQHAKHIAGKWFDVAIDYDDLHQEGAITALQILAAGIPDQQVEKTYAYLHARIAGRMRDVLRTAQGRNIDKRTEALDDIALDEYMHFNGPEEIAIAEEGLKKTMRRLKPREREILEAVMKGYRNTEIGKQYGVTLSAISHVLHENILPKLAL